MRERILSMGEAVVDVLPAGDGLWRPVPGGSSYNVALALGRLGAPAAFVGRLSGDAQGSRMTAALADAGVDLDLLARDERPSPLALVERGTETQSARYAIHLADTAHAPPDLPADWREAGAHLHVSSFSAIAGAWGEAVARALEDARGAMTTSFDVNIRPALSPPRAQTLALVEQRIGRADIVKASDEDLAWLCPDEAPEVVAADWSRRFGCLTLLTRGAEGATAFVDGWRVERPAIRAPVVDTVGAGDTFVAAFLAGALAREALDSLRRADASLLARLLDEANAAAALCCMRAGADAPTAAEIDMFRRSSHM